MGENSETGKIYEQLCAVMAEIEAVSKNKTNTQQNYKYRSIDDVYNMIQPIFGKNKVFILPKVSNIKEEERQSKSGGTLFYTTLEMEYTFYTADGSSLTTIATGKSMDSGDKSLDKAKSSAMKYLLLQMFLIPTEEDKDTEMASPEVKPKEKIKEEPTLPESPVNNPLKTVEEVVAGFKKRINEIDNVFELKGWGTKHSKEIKALPAEQYQEIRTLYAKRESALNLLALAEKIGVSHFDLKTYLIGLPDLSLETEAMLGNAEAIKQLTSEIKEYLKAKQETIDDSSLFNEEAENAKYEQ